MCHKDCKGCNHSTYNDIVAISCCWLHFYFVSSLRSMCQKCPDVFLGVAHARCHWILALEDKRSVGVSLRSDVYQRNRVFALVRERWWCEKLSRMIPTVVPSLEYRVLRKGQLTMVFCIQLRSASKILAPNHLIMASLSWLCTGRLPFQNGVEMRVKVIRCATGIHLLQVVHKEHHVI